ncbi:MAG: hypothetical protein IPJ03_04730 [Ignavibacteriales bacterium]|nr:hypothetical protein [Ignavibacteriales bacterium]
MSWIFGYKGIVNDQELVPVVPFDNVLFSFKSGNLFIAAGGNPDSCFYSTEEKWIACGFGIIELNDQKRMMTREDWSYYFTAKFKPEIEGHFIVLRWGVNELHFYNDTFGLRTIYFLESASRIFFATDLNKLTPFMKSVEMDFGVFGSRWLLFNQMSNESFIKAVKKLPPYSEASIKSTALNILRKNFNHNILVTTKENLYSSIRKYLNIKLPDQFCISLGLSGGLDSRMLLAFMLKEKLNFKVHTFGYEDDQDAIVANRIGNSLNLDLKHIKYQPGYDDDFIKRLNNYCAEIKLAEPASSYIKLRVFEDDYFQNKILIDGALAEFARRQFMNRLLIRGRKFLFNKDYISISKLLTVHRASIFNAEIQKEMNSGILEDIENIFSELPDVSKVGAENFVDLMVLKYRIPNYFGPEQSRLDNIMLSFMPFAQFKLILTSLGIPAKHRRNGNLFYKAIDEYYPPLKKIPLVKNGITYSYGSSTIKSFLITSVKKRFIKTSSYNYKVGLFDFIEAYVRDLFADKQAQQCSIYDQAAVKKIISDYYSGNKGRVDDLDWLYTFEMFRRKMNIS